MESIFRDDITRQETAFYLKSTFLIPQYIKSSKYKISEKEMKEFVTNLKENTSLNVPIGVLAVSDVYTTETLLKRCFSKCKQFVLEDWIDYDELDCTMKCTLLHKKALKIMTDINRNI
jgi:hypothetical protein